MHFSSTGEAFGLISGGCLEEDLAERVPEMIRCKSSVRLTYDMRSEDDFGWGKGAGCNGSIEVLLEYVCDEELNLLMNELRQGKTVYSVRKTQSGQKRVSYVIDEHGSQLGQVSNEAEKEYARRLARSVEENGEKLVTEEAHGALWVAESFEPKARLYVFGAGKDAEPVVQRAAELQFHVTVIDANRFRCSAEHFPLAERLICRRPEQFFAEETLDDGAYALIMTHRFEEDAEILAHLLTERERFNYIGVLGPRRRTAKLLGGQPVPAAVSSPVGLDIQADGADEISISILAELILTRNKKSAARGQLTEMH